MGSHREQISTAGLWSLMLIFNVASAITVPIGAVAGQDVWISILLALAAGSLIVWTYSRLHESHPGKSISEIAEGLLGNWAGRVVGVFYLWYSFHLGSLVLRDFVEFLSAVALPRTPIPAILFPILAVVVWGVYLGVEVLSRYAQTIYLFVIFEVLVSSLLLFNQFDYRNLLPVLDKGWSPVLEGAIQITTFPFGETVIFAFIIPFLNQTDQVRKTSLRALLTGGALLLLVHVRNILVFGGLASKLTYPTFSVYQYISLFDFLDRVEPLAIVTWILAGYIEISVCLFACAMSLAHVTKSSGYRIYVIPLALLMGQMSRFIYDNHAELIATAANAWPWYSLPFQIGIPLMLLLASVFHKRRRARTKGE